ncbi:MAG: DUF1990 domain-containing protein [Planctomycetia bacterium]|nr:DUF1990 domain-containing protein [Planctomycetia bacterium]
MFTLKKPSQPDIRRFLSEQSRLEYTYSAVGATAGKPPAGFNVDHTRRQLGSGDRTFLAATQALQRWRQFRFSWLEAGPADTPIQTGEVVAVLARLGVLWSLNACRIVYVVDESGPIDRFGFAYGTLPGHVEMGEERFLVEWDHANDSVWYDILAFSRPRHPLARLAYPLARLLQKRFARDSAAAMLATANE